MQLLQGLTEFRFTGGDENGRIGRAENSSAPKSAEYSIELYSSGAPGNNRKMKMFSRIFLSCRDLQ